MSKKKLYYYKNLSTTEKGRKKILRLIAEDEGRSESLPKHKWEKKYLILLKKYPSYVEHGVPSQGLAPSLDKLMEE